MSKLSASILSADFANLAEDVARVESSGGHYTHIDIMDGHFVPNISYGSAVMKSLLGKTTMPFDVHLMIENPDFYIKDYVTENTEYITVHQEACRHIDRTVDYIHQQGVKAGIAINPGTPVSTLTEMLDKVELVLVMSVNPGFGGQSFIESSLKKIKELDKLRKDNNYKFLIEIDGGINLANAKEVVDAGTDLIVAGSAVFGAADVEETTKAFIERIK